MRTRADVLDMRPDGSFVERPMPTLGGIAARVVAFGVLLCVAFAAFWATVFLLPVIIVLGLAGGLMFRAQLRRGGVVMPRRGRA